MKSRNIYTEKSYLGANDIKKDYKKGKVSIPKNKNKGIEDDPEYFLQWARYIYAQYHRGGTTIGADLSTGSGKSHTQIRQYALGRQDPGIYADELDPCEDGDEGYMNINWDVVAIMPKFRDLMRGKLLGADYEVNTEAIDAVSGKQRIDTVNKMKLSVSPMMKQAMAETGTKASGVNIPNEIENPADVDYFYKMGGVRLEREIIIKDAIEVTQYESDWETIKDMLVNDAIDLNIVATHTKLDLSTGKIKLHRVAPEQLVCRRSEYPDHRDIDFAGVVRSKSISQLREENAFNEEVLLKIAKAYSGVGKNSEFEVNFNGYDNLYQPTAPVDSDFAYDNFKIDTLEFYFIAKEAENHIIGYHKNGNNMIYDEVDMASTLSKKDLKRGKEMQSSEFEYVYRCEWVIGTSFVFNYGKETAIVKEKANGVKRAILPIQIYSDRSPSLMERCIAHVDDIQIAILKLRNAISKHIPAPRIIFDLSVLEDSVEMGGQNYDMKDLIATFPKTGIMVLRSKSEFGDEYGAANKKPFEIIQNSGLENDIQMFLMRIQSSLDQIRQVTGVNEVSDGSTQQQDMLKGVLEGLSAATNTALRPTFRLYEGWFGLWAKYCAMKWQVAALAGDISLTHSPLGDMAIKHFKVTKDLYDYDFGIKIVLRPSEKDRQMLMQDLFNKKEQQVIGYQDYFVLANLVQSGNLKRAQVYYARAVEEQAAKMHQKNLEVQRAQAEANGEAGVKLEEAKMKAMQAKTQMELEMIEAEGRMKIKVLNEEYDRKLELQREAIEAGLGRDIVNNSMQIGAASIKGQKAIAEKGGQ